MKTIREILGSLKDDACLLINPPNIELLLTGVTEARIAKDGRITLEYLDRTQESRVADDTLLDTRERELTLFALVSYVQKPRTCDAHDG